MIHSSRRRYGRGEFSYTRGNQPIEEGDDKTFIFLALRTVGFHWRTHNSYRTPAGPPLYIATTCNADQLLRAYTKTVSQAYLSLTIEPPRAAQVFPVHIPTEQMLKRLKLRSSSCTCPDALRTSPASAPSSAAYIGDDPSAIGLSAFFASMVQHRSKRADLMSNGLASHSWPAVERA